MCEIYSPYNVGAPSLRFYTAIFYRGGPIFGRPLFIWGPPSPQGLLSGVVSPPCGQICAGPCFPLVTQSCASSKQGGALISPLGRRRYLFPPRKPHGGQPPFSQRALKGVGTKKMWPKKAPGGGKGITPRETKRVFPLSPPQRPQWGV